MNLSPSQLAESNATLLDKLEHNELIPFVRTYLDKKTTISRIYNIINILFLFGIGTLFGMAFHYEGFQLGTGVFYLSIGIACAFFLLPFHEIIHVLAYKWVGAKETSFDMNLKKFYFMALAHNFIADRKEFFIVAISPFLVITTLILIATFLVPFYWKFTLMGTILMHSLMSSGDFGLLSYFDFHKDKKVVTYDDIENKVSYFYEVR